MSNFYILTNNPMVQEKYPKITELDDNFSVGDIFAGGRNAIHLGAHLINHPLAGSIKPNQSPYKSLVLSDDKGELDLFSLKLIEGAIQVLRKFPSRSRPYDESILEDFQVVDLDLLDSAIDSLPYEYHE
ncbi:GrdX family protein [Companilactobacillus versmoldensis]|uniref:GrdX protein n=1 Tax=Companilactobacillus versmoldensis DSM 14857 = KCTC 3814 TaxID=1423815 RepID=A0A0R1SM03_9LACO|nr:GrdX family protein [Companilactobacillus versmoldensis]KRL67317.1 GrdX protein [Companilactobacillus versmoldensis DSM 14857 = KCTC 3814]